MREGKVDTVTEERWSEREGGGGRERKGRLEGEEQGKKTSVWKGSKAERHE